METGVVKERSQKIMAYIRKEPREIQTMWQLPATATQDERLNHTSTWDSWHYTPSTVTQIVSKALLTKYVRNQGRIWPILSITLHRKYKLWRRERGESGLEPDPAFQIRKRFGQKVANRSTTLVACMPYNEGATIQYQKTIWHSTRILRMTF
jgi:hypothetical protein